MNLKQATQYLHERHPQEVDPPEPVVDSASLALDAFWLQSHACECIEDRDDKKFRKFLESTEHVLRNGDDEVKQVVLGHMIVPDLAFQAEADWPAARMTPLLADLCARIRSGARV